MSASKIYAVIDTNVIISALLGSNPESNPRKIVKAIYFGQIIPLFNKEIIDEYRDVLHRVKFSFVEEDINEMLGVFEYMGINSERIESDEKLPDPKDVVFYEVSLSVDGAFLVTGNKKHFPVKTTVVSPAELVQLLEL